MGEATSSGGSSLVGPYLKNHGYDRVLLAGPTTRMVSGHLVLAVGGDRPCVRIHVVHELSRELLDLDKKNSRASNYLAPIHLAAMFHIVEQPTSVRVAGRLLK
jgi:hypothetical protein